MVRQRDPGKSISFVLRYHTLFKLVGKISNENLNLLYMYIEVKRAFSGLTQFLATEILLKMIKSAFYFMSKALFVPKIFKFLSWLFGHVSKRLDKKNKINFKFYDFTAWLTIVIHALANIWRSKSNQAIKFGQLIECNLRNIFREKSYTKCSGKTSPRSFSQKLKWRISLDP